MNIREFSNLVEKYKKGECSPDEKEFLENFLESFQDNPGEWLTNEMGNQNIAEERIYSEIIKNINKKKNYNANRIFSPLMLKIAATIVFVIFLGLGILYVSEIFQQKTGSVVWYEKVTSPSKKSVLTLSDGSKVTLNADSKLRYPDHFNKTNREVYLKGEGYFVVEHNINRPFIVHAGKLTTIVLGTKFDVSAYPENKSIAVSLLEGKVKVSRSEKGKSNEIVVLKPKEQLLYNVENNVSSFGVFDSLKAIGWKDNIYKFDDESIGKVLPRLERAFGVKFKLTDQSVLSQKITVRFENDSLQTVLYVIKSLTGMDYKIVKENSNKRKVIFF